MNFRFTVVETSLNRAEFRWKWLKFLRHTFVLGIAVCGALCLLAGLVVTGMVGSKTAGTVFLVLLAVFGLITWFVLVVRLLAGSTDRFWLASSLEQADRRLMDRLNTLLFLESRRGEAKNESFALRIARQTQKILAKKVAPPFAATGVWQWLGIFLLSLIVTVLLYRTVSPWERLSAPGMIAQQQSTEVAPIANLELPTTNNVEQNQNWGEVRITDPGADLKVTKVDVVPLQIEAAANQPLQKVSWFSTVNGLQETAHELPAPAEPRYAVYQPTVYLDELGLSDWDVLTYYAKANTEQQSAFASGVYFLEVRPFREDILKIPGGPNGKAYACLNELSALIGRQQHVIRETHQHIQTPAEQPSLQAQDRKKLSEAEHDLSDSTHHLYARMAAQLENKPIGDALDNLAKAEKTLKNAGASLAEDVLEDAQKQERSALTELVAARKAFQKALSENPRDFEEPEEDVPVVDSAQLLKAMAEFKNETKAAEDFLRKAVEQQRTIEQKARTAGKADQARLAGQEQQLKNSLQDFQEQHPKLFASAQEESLQARQSLTEAADKLQKRSTDAKVATQKATAQLEQLNQAVAGQSAGRQLADAYKLKELLDRQIDTFGQCANQPTNINNTQLQQTVAASRETINQLKRMAEQEPTRDAFDGPLRDSLSGSNKVDLDSKLNQVQQAQGDASKQQACAGAKQALSKVSQAFRESEPKALQQAQNGDALIPSEQESFSVGLDQLSRLLKQCKSGSRLGSGAQTRQAQEALYYLQTGLRSQYGSNEQGKELLVKMDQLCKAEVPLEVGDLKKLMEQLQHFSVETADQLAKKEDHPEVSNIDASRLPPAYRGRIQKYFQKLSER